MARQTDIAKRKPKGRRHKHVIITVVCILIAAILITIGTLIFLNREQIFTEASKADSSEEAPSDDKKSAETKPEKRQKEEDVTEEAPREAEKAPVAKYEGENPNNLETITGNVNYAGISNGVFMVRVTLDQELGDAGTCNFTLTSTNGKTIDSTSATSAGPSTSFCAYSISAAQIPSGNWKIVVEVTASGKEGIITGEANI